MKKVIFSLAIAAMAAFALTSCTGNADTTDGTCTDSVGTEQQEAAEQAEVPVGEQTELACDKYVLKVPEGFKASSRMVNYSCNMGQQEAPFVTVAPNFQSNTTPEAFKAAVEKDNYTAIDDITVGNNTYNAFYWFNAEDNNCHHVKVATPQGDGVVTIHFFTGASQMEKDAAKEALMTAVQTVLNNMTIK